MKKREFLRLTGIMGAGVVVAPFFACGPGEPNTEGGNASEGDVPPPPPPMKEFTLPELGYAFDALAPSIDAMTMEIHHGKHHAGYVRKLNAALAETPGFEGLDIAGILENVSPDQSGVRNNGGGHFNHSMFWKVMEPGGANAPSGDLAAAIDRDLGSYDAFKESFFSAAKSRFGSGWAWLCVGENKKLFIMSTANQDNPLMNKVVEQTGMPILGIDVWEHAYYLNYQNMRGDYINAFMEVINWDRVAEYYAVAVS